MACALKRLASEWCDPQGTYEPTICAEGFYCPIPGDRQIECPSGHYCPFGSYKPIDCPWLSICGKGVAQPRHLGVVMVMVLVDLALGLAIALYYFYRKRKHTRFFSMRSETSEDTGSENVASPRDTSEELDEMENGEKVQQTATQVLIEGFHLSRGNQPLLDFDFSELGLKIPGGKKVLHGVTGTIRHGQVTAVMGPSGAGKTTFLNTLMGKVDSSWKTEGSLKVNGAEAKGLSKLKKLIGYVPQEDVMHRELSVWQNLNYAASVRLPREWDHDQRTRHVNAVLEVLDLVHVRNSPIGDESTRGVSGGQRKRVNIGLELAACPLALFCDEPTSGLDSSASLAVVSAVKKVARSTGMTVVMVIHQPRVEIWNSLDRVLILAPGGITAYLGEQRFVTKYFKQLFGLEFEPTDNPADVVMDYISKYGSECANTWKKSGEEWLTAYAAKNRSGDEFDDELAESLSHTLRLKNSQSIAKGTGIGSSQTLNRSSESVRASQTMGVIQDAGSSSSAIIRPSKDFTEDDMLDEADNANDHVVRGANFLWQIWYVFLRSMKQQYVNLSSLILEMGLAVLAGAVIGFSAQMHYRGVAIVPYTPLTPAPEATIVPQKHLYIAMSVGIAAASAGVKAFGEDMVIYWREASSGHNRISYYIGQTLSMIPRIVLGGLHFTCMFIVLSQSYVGFGSMMLNVSLIFYAVYGLSAVVSMIVPRRDAPLLAAVICVIAAVLNGYVRTIPVQISYLSYTYWSHETFFNNEVAVYEHVYQTKISRDYFHLKPDRNAMDYGLMFVIGTIYRVIGLVLLLFLNRDKQR